MTSIRLDSLRVRKFDSMWFTDENIGEIIEGGISFQQNKVWCSCNWIIPAMKLAMNSSSVTCRIRGSPGWKAQIDIRNFECDYSEASGDSLTEDDQEITVTSTTTTAMTPTIPFKTTTLHSELEFDVEIDQSNIDSDNILEPKESPVVIFNSQDVTSDNIMSSRSIFDDDFEESGDYLSEDIFVEQTEVMESSENLSEDQIEYDFEYDFEYEEKSEMSDLEFESLIEMLELHFNNVEPTVSVNMIGSSTSYTTTSRADESQTTTTASTTSDETTGTTTSDTTTTKVATTGVTTTSTTEAVTVKLQSQIPPQRVPLFSFVQHHSREIADDTIDETRTSTTTSSPMKTTSTMSQKQKRILRQEKVREKAAQRRERDRQRAIEAKKKREARIMRDKVKKVNSAIEKAERTWAAKQIAAIKKDVKISKENQENALRDFKVEIIDHSLFTIRTQIR